MYCAPYLEASAPAQTSGRLYHLPQGYPALTEEPGWVQGTVLYLKPDMATSALKALDQFEDYDPTGSPPASPDQSPPQSLTSLPTDSAAPDSANQYTRCLRPIFTPGGQPMGMAWMYIMAISRVQADGGTWIPSGTWSRRQWPTITP